MKHGISFCVFLALCTS